MYLFPSISLTMDYRLVLALLFSILLHMVAMLSIDRFALFPPVAKRSPPRLEITLLPKQKQQEEAPKKVQQPDFLAQRNTTGEGIVKKQASLPPTPTEQPSAPTSPPPRPATEKVEKESFPSTKTPALATPQKTPPQLTQEQAPQRALSTNPSSPEAGPSEALATPQPSAQELIAALEGQLAKGFQQDSKQPRKRHLDFRTKDYMAMAYLDAWCKKIERVGKMNYPAQAKRQGLSGSLSLVVDLNPDGSLANIMVRRSSGHKILDEAAVRIVLLAAPFAKVPESILQGQDILSITRRWQFHSNADFKAQ